MSRLMLYLNNKVNAVIVNGLPVVWNIVHKAFVVKNH